MCPMTSKSYEWNLRNIAKNCKNTSCYRWVNALAEVEEPAEIGYRWRQVPIATDHFCFQG